MTRRSSLKPRRSLDFERINSAALAAMPAVLRRQFPAGKVEGAEYCVGNLHGDPGRSLKINLRTGVWRDFAGDVGGSDPVSLVAARERIGQAEAAQMLARMVGVE